MPVTMPKFFYTLIFLTLAFFGLGAYVVIFLPPEGWRHFAFFFGALLGSATFLLATLSFAFATLIFHRPRDRETLRPLLRRSFFLGLFIVSLALLRWQHLWHWWTTGPLAVTLLIIEIYLTRRIPPRRFEQKPLENIFLRKPPTR